MPSSTPPLPSRPIPTYTEVHGWTAVLDPCCQGSILMTEKKIMTQTPHFRIASIPADGIGPEVISSAIEVVNTLASTLKTFTIEFTHLPWGTAHYKEHGTYIPEGALDHLKSFDAGLFGSVGAPGKPQAAMRDPPNHLANDEKMYPTTSPFGASSWPSAVPSSCMRTFGPSELSPALTLPSRRSTTAASTG